MALRVPGFSQICIQLVCLLVTQVKPPIFNATTFSFTLPHRPHFPLPRVLIRFVTWSLSWTQTDSQGGRLLSQLREEGTGSSQYKIMLGLLISQTVPFKIATHDGSIQMCWEMQRTSLLPCQLPMQIPLLPSAQMACLCGGRLHSWRSPRLSLSLSLPKGYFPSPAEPPVLDVGAL